MRSLCSWMHPAFSNAQYELLPFAFFDIVKEHEKFWWLDKKTIRHQKRKIFETTEGLGNSTYAQEDIWSIV